VELIIKVIAVKTHTHLIPPLQHRRTEATLMRMSPWVKRTPAAASSRVQSRTHPRRNKRLLL